MADDDFHVASNFMAFLKIRKVNSMSEIWCLVPSIALWMPANEQSNICGTFRTQNFPLRSSFKVHLRFAICNQNLIDFRVWQLKADDSNETFRSRVAMIRRRRSFSCERHFQFGYINHCKRQRIYLRSCCWSDKIMRMWFIARNHRMRREEAIR